MSKLTYDILYPIDLDTFFDNYIHNIQRVERRVEEYIKDPNEKNVHDIRTAIRRLEASYQSSPKQLQKKKIKKYVVTSKHLFKLNSEIRDFDIILEILSNEGKMSEQQLEPLKQSLESEKGNKLSKALSIADKIRKLNALHLVKEDGHYNRNKMQKKLIKRYTKIAGNFVSRIEKNLPVVINDWKKIDELHEIRKDCKKLRYLLEVLQSDRDRRNENIENNGLIGENRGNDIHGVSDLIRTLENIQDMLGNIHDYDITIAYSKRHDKYVHNDAENNVAMIRKNHYDQFIQYCKSDLLKSNNNFFINKHDLI
jgi:CHAD domain-containing protein